MEVEQDTPHCLPCYVSCVNKDLKVHAGRIMCIRCSKMQAEGHSWYCIPSVSRLLADVWQHVIFPGADHLADICRWSCTSSELSSGMYLQLESAFLTRTRIACQCDFYVRHSGAIARKLFWQCAVSHPDVPSASVQTVWESSCP